MEAAQQQTTQQAAPQQPPVETTQQSKPSPEMEALLRKERFIRDQQKQLQEQKTAWEQERAELQKKAERAKFFEENLKKDPYKVYEELGMKSDEVAALLANQPDPQAQEFNSLKQEIAALKQELESSKTAQTEERQKAYENVKNQIAFDVKTLIDGKEDFELINAHGQSGVDKVVGLIEKYFEEFNKVLDYQQAAKLVEEKYEEEALKLAALKKVQAKLSKPQDAQNEAMKTDASVEMPKGYQPKTYQQPKIKTLTNEMTAAMSKRSASEEERIKRAMLAFQGKLSS